MSAAPSVSVVMTAYNREPYIAAAIESVLTQTFTDFELLVVDDASTDRTVEIASRYLVDPRVRVIVNERNLGDYPNRNHAATLARGEFLKYHDSDDLMYPHCLEVMVSGLRAASEAACALTFGRGWAGGPCPMLLTPRLAFEREYLGQGLFHVGPAGALFRREALAGLGGFPEVGITSDNVFWFTLCASHNVLLVQCDLFWYRLHPGQEKNRPRALYDRIDCDRFGWEFLASDRCPLTGPQRDQARRNRAFLSAKHLLDDVRHGSWRLAWYRFRRSGLRPMDWVRCVGRPIRDLNAGSPRDESGELAVPASMRLPVVRHRGRGAV